MNAIAFEFEDSAEVIDSDDSTIETISVRLPK